MKQPDFFKYKKWVKKWSSFSSFFLCSSHRQVVTSFANGRWPSSHLSMSSSVDVDGEKADATILNLAWLVEATSKSTDKCKGWLKTLEEAEFETLHHIRTASDSTWRQINIPPLICDILRTAAGTSSGMPCPCLLFYIKLSSPCLPFLTVSE